MVLSAEDLLFNLSKIIIIRVTIINPKEIGNEWPI